MTPSRIATAGLVASALLVAPVSSAFADGPHWSKSSSHHGSASHGGGYHGPVWHGGSDRGPAWHGGGGYWRGGVWWPFAAVGALVGTAAAIVAAPFVAFGNAVANTPYYAPPQPYYPAQGYSVAPPNYAPQQQYYVPQGYSAPPPNYAPQQQYYVPQGYSAPPPNYAPQQQYYAPQGYNVQPSYSAPPNYPPVTTTYQRPRVPAPVYYSYNN